MYTYVTSGNGMFLQILHNGEEIAFLQGDEACERADELDACETDEQIQNILSGYDFGQCPIDCSGD